MSDGVGGVVRWGILGAASIARTVVAATTTLTELEFTAVASRSPERAARFAEEMGIPRSFASYEELLACEEVDAVYVALPIAQHAPWTIAALDAGKHVLCEKPLATTPADAVRTFDAAERAGRLVVEGFMYRRHPQTLLAQQLTTGGVIGTVTSVRAALSVNVPPGDIRRTAALGGGASLDLGCYCLNAIRTFGGEPEEVFAYQVPDPTDADVDLRLNAVLTLAGGALASFDVGLDLPRRDQLEIVGTLGRLEVPDPWLCRSGYLVLEVDGVRTEVPVDPDGAARLTGEEGDAYRLEFAAVSRQFAAGGADASARAEAVAQATSIAAIQQAATSGSPTHL